LKRVGNTGGDLCTTLTTIVASRPKILQNNSKPARLKAAENRPKKIFDEKHVFFLANLSFFDKLFCKFHPREILSKAFSRFYYPLDA
jgi:hypothetical protein